METSASPSAVPGLRSNMVTICAMTATIMQALDTTIANVALPLSLIHISEPTRPY